MKKLVIYIFITARGEMKRWWRMVMPPFLFLPLFPPSPPPLSFLHSFPPLLSLETFSHIRNLFSPQQSVSISRIWIRFFLISSCHFLTTFLFCKFILLFFVVVRKKNMKKSWSMERRHSRSQWVTTRRLTL
jgi:hypothetical protein